MPAPATTALASYERAAAAAAANALPRPEHKIGQVYYRRGEWNLAENQFAQAEADWQETGDWQPEIWKLSEW